MYETFCSILYNYELILIRADSTEPGKPILHSSNLQSKAFLPSTNACVFSAPKINYQLSINESIPSSVEILGS